ncbi:glucan-binding protein [Lacihabitans sp. LS3-19]|uniref:prolyl oligopeptidase family serine peptidase n=1 Tax=Lacihabitans sp. LS3-19 TaxID=2487335 RepID=UPI0020CE142D|nr:prolyl oligopeptidase family serine peptidase [Lacihabitans sp. LS3-19]MCP9770483.1 glucan-binding protein [Lacihabitans sp. LS3-19]
MKEMKFGKLFLLLLLVFGIFQKGHSQNPQSREYTAIIEGFDWGPMVNKVVVGLNAPAKSVDMADYSVYAERSHDCAEVPVADAKGNRTVIFAYVSDSKGSRLEEGSFVTLILYVAPNLSICSALQYSRKAECRGNQWVNYKMTVTNNKTNQVWDKEKGRIMPIIDEFDLSGKYEYETGKSLTYAHFIPKKSASKAPLIIWLHGGGEGGTDPSIALTANKAFNYASPEIQKYFGGAYVLVPQTPGAWMHDKDGKTQSGNGEDVYNVGLMALIKEYVNAHPGIDKKRIYLGGCSNGGYMSLKLILKEPNYFAAGYISALAYQSQYITDAQINSIKNVPIWFIQSKDDKTTDPVKTAIPVYERLKKAGAKNVHFSFYEHVTDLSGMYGGENYYFNGHWSWIYSHANQSHTEYDGSEVLLNDKPTTLMEWTAAQAKK